MWFSVITVCKNNFAGLLATYESVKNQTCQDIEWVVIDGNSTDGTKDWLTYILRDKAKWVSEPDSGIYNAMNKGLTLVSGDYIIFMNSGDIFAQSDTLAEVNSVINGQSTPPDFIYADSIDAARQDVGLYKKARPHYMMWMGMFTHHQAMIFNRTRLEKLRYLEQFRFSADYAFVCEYLCTKGGDEPRRIIKLDFPICIFELGGVNAQHRLRALVEDFRIRGMILQQSIFLRIVLYVLHLAHYILKRILPCVTRRLRYSSFMHAS